VAENSIEQTSNDDKYPSTKPVEEVAGQRDTKSADAADSADSDNLRQSLLYILQFISFTREQT
jgi:hypothetical protein